MAHHAAAVGKSTVVSGSYRALWNDLDLGLTLDGFTMNQVNTGIDIQADVTGDTTIDTIYSGTSLSVSMTLIHWNAQALEAMIWWMGNSDPTAYEWGLTNGVGQRHWDAAAPLILYACQSTGFSLTTPEDPDPDLADVDSTIVHPTAAAASNPNIDPLDIVFYKTLLQKDTNLDIVFSFRPRFVTLTLDVFPCANLNDAGTALDSTAPDNIGRVTDCAAIRYFSATRGTAPT